jgi:hypothetical protein
VIKQRLLGRAQGIDPLDASEADIEVYKKMRRQVQTIRRPHLVVDTSKDVEPFVKEVLNQLVEAESNEQ